MTLIERFPSMSAEAVRLRSYFLPIEGTPSHPDNPVRNFLVKTNKTPHSERRASYVNTMVLRTVPFGALQAYKDGPGGWSQDYSIDAESYGKLCEFMRARPPPMNLIGWEMKFKKGKGKGKGRLKEG